MKVTLGELDLRDFEKPDFVQRGGKQMLAIREFPGGSVSIQNMGPTYRPITWSGVFLGADAHERMMSIGLMRTAGKPIEFSCELFSFTVLIEEFYPDQKSNQRIPFSITLRHVDTASNKPALLIDSIDKNSSNDTASSSDPNKTYTVREGDSLWSIAKNETTSKNPNDWEKIYQANVDVLVNGPHVLTPGMVLKVNV
ncbi:LysM domain-containing protein [Bacillus sp. 3255]|uniref:LysM peptidoglycan-binding domain-containing protein n=1 Tax=Bacillus sp. 3255 TaxID=2817904 RepID=UPI00285A6F4F|nr:LysM domain-containing protein [Bacillus sp. 3255]MDR6883019.1 nucleoid-associated protein YgaU [Bacillus sp. 3255]